MQHFVVNQLKWDSLYEESSDSIDLREVACRAMKLNVFGARLPGKTMLLNTLIHGKASVVPPILSKQSRPRIAVRNI